MGPGETGSPIEIKFCTESAGGGGGGGGGEGTDFGPLESPLTPPNYSQKPKFVIFFL